MLELLTTVVLNQNFYSLILVPIFTGLFGIILWFLSLATGREMNLNLGILKLSTPSRKKKELPSGVYEQMKIKNSNQTLLISKLQSFITEKQKLIFNSSNENIERQMNFFDEKLVEIRSLYIEEYARLLAKKTEPHVDVRNHQEFRNYRMMVDLMLEDVKIKTFKKSIKQNHLADITMELWESFVEQKVNVTLALIKNYFDDCYPDDMTISRADIDEANDRVFDKCRSLFTLSYRRAREIAIETRTKIKYIEDEIEREVREENVHLTNLGGCTRINRMCERIINEDKNKN